MNITKFGEKHRFVDSRSLAKSKMDKLKIHTHIPTCTHIVSTSVKLLKTNIKGNALNKLETNSTYYGTIFLIIFDFSAFKKAKREWGEKWHL